MIKIFCWICLVGILWLASCGTSVAASLERKDIAELMIVEKQGSDGKILHVRFSIPFYYDFGKPKTRTSGETLIVRIPNDGEFTKCDSELDFYLKVPPSVKKVKLGSDEIWPQDTFAPLNSFEQTVRDAAVKQYRIDFPDNDANENFIRVSPCENLSGRISPGDPLSALERVNRHDARKYRVTFSPPLNSNNGDYVDGGHYAEYLVSSADGQILELERPIRPPSYIDAINQSQWVGVCEYSGYEKREDITFEDPPTANFRWTETLVGPPLDRSLRIRFQFSEYPTERKPDGWTFSEDKMPEIGSKWIIFIQDAASLPADGYKTLRGSYGRQVATEKNLDGLYMSVQELMGQRANYKVIHFSVEDQNTSR